jgi:hypothetical protein
MPTEAKWVGILKTKPLDVTLGEETLFLEGPTLRLI